MKNKSITLNFILSPVNITAILTKKVLTKNIDPVDIFLFSGLNTLIVSTYIYLIFLHLYDKKLGIFIVSCYFLITCLMGIVLGSVDQIFNNK